MKRWMTGLVPMVMLWFSATSAFADYVTGHEHISGSIFTEQYTIDASTYGPFGNAFSYARTFDGEKVVKEVQIAFVFDVALAFDPAEEAAYRAAVEVNIERIWNNKFVLVETASQRSFPVLVDLTTTGPVFDQFVTVHAGSGRADVLNWFVEDSAGVNAHEFGHMLGLYDEYIGGALRFPDPIVSDLGVMGLGALSPTPEMFPRYFEQYVDFVSTLNPGHTFRLVAVPEPATILLVVIGSGALLFARRRA